MYSCVWASTPTVTRTITRGRFPSSRASAVRRSISSNESTMIRPTPASRARRSSLVDLLLPCRPSRSGGIPAAGLTARAHVEAEPLLGDHAHDRLAQERLAGVEDVGVSERLPEFAAARPEVG